MITTADILEFLKLCLRDSVDAAYVSKIMRPLEIDSAWVHLGGSGARQQIFQLRDNVRIVFQFDGEDHLQAYGVYKSKEALESDKNNSTVYPVSGPDISLIYFEQK
jgi:hypothetical protein